MGNGDVLDTAGGRRRGHSIVLHVGSLAATLIERREAWEDDAQPLSLCVDATGRSSGRLRKASSEEFLIKLE